MGVADDLVPVVDPEVLQEGGTRTGRRGDLRERVAAPQEPVRVAGEGEADDVTAVVYRLAIVGWLLRASTVPCHHRTATLPRRVPCLLGHYWVAFDATRGKLSRLPTWTTVVRAPQPGTGARPG
jgi:hypothetical protein